jgi:hypothetical protein
MSTGGNVPTQGVAVQAATTEKKRGSRCQGKPTGFTYGKGRPGLNLRRMYRKELKLWQPKGTYPYKSVKAFARHLAKGKDVNTEAAELAKKWLSGKRPGGSDEQRAARKEKKQRIADLRYAEAASSKSSSGKRKSA